jgi:serine/threonine protein kinase
LHTEELTKLGLQADVWSLGITIIELAEGLPPNHDMNPMRAMRMVPVKPAPTMTDPSLWSQDMNDFVVRTAVSPPLVPRIAHAQTSG